MELSVFIARIAAVIYLAASPGGFINPEHYRRLVRDLYDNAALTYLTGFIAVVFGLLIIGDHNLWVADWRSAGRRQKRCGPEACSRPARTLPCLEA